MNLWSVDRIVGDMAVLVDDNGNTRDIAMGELPDSIKEGVLLRLIDGVYITDKAATEMRKNAVLSLQDKLRRKQK